MYQIPVYPVVAPKSPETSGAVALFGKLSVDEGEHLVRGLCYGLVGKYRGHMKHLSTDEHLPPALHILLLLVILCVTKYRHNLPIALLPQYGHLRVVAAQNAGVPILLVIFFHIRLSSHIRERLASAHGLLPSWFFLMIVLLVAKGDLFLPLLAEGFLICALVRGWCVPHALSAVSYTCL